MQASANDSASSRPSKLLSDQKILVVEDEYIQAESHCIMVREAGGTVVGPYARVEPSIAAIVLEAPSIALVDLKLAEGEVAYDLIDALLGAGIPILVVTGYECCNLPVAYRGLHCLTKPTSHGEIRAALRRVMTGEMACHRPVEVGWDVEPVRI